MQNDLSVNFQAQHCRLEPEDEATMHRSLEALRRVTAEFPVATLHVRINRHPRACDYHVKASLHLPKRTLFTGDRDRTVHPAFERCVRKLVRKVKAYRDRMDYREALAKEAKGTRHPFVADLEPDRVLLDRALAENDLDSFRRAVSPYDASLHAAVGRWVKRYPEVDEALGSELFIGEIVEEVRLNAFESLLVRPLTGRLGDRLWEWIEPSIRALADVGPRG